MTKIDKYVEKKGLNILMPSDDEDAAITKAALADPDNQPMSDAVLASLRPASETHPEIVARAKNRNKDIKRIIDTSETLTHIFGDEPDV